MTRLTTASEQDFRLEADRALERLQRALLPMADEHGFEVELQNGVLQIVFEDPVAGEVRRQPQRARCGRSGCRRCRAATSWRGSRSRPRSRSTANRSTR